MSTRGQQVKDRLEWAADIFPPDARTEGLDDWFAEGAQWVSDLARAVHMGNPRAVDERAVRHWQQYGRNMEKVARATGLPGLRDWQRTRAE